MYRIASIHLAKNQEPIFINIEKHTVDTWRDLCHVIGGAEGIMAVDARMTVHYFVEPPDNALIYANPWLPVDLEDVVDLKPGKSLVVRLNLPNAHFKRRYVIRVIRADNGQQKRRCSIM